MQNTKRICALFMKRLNNRHIFSKPSLIITYPRVLLTFKPTITRAITSGQNKCYHDDTFTDNEDDLETIYQEQPKAVKHILYQNSDDPLLPILNASASLQEVFDFIKKYEKIVQPIHLAQSVLVLWDLQRMFQHVTEMTNIDKVDKLMEDYKQELLKRQEFLVLLDFLKDNLDFYGDEELSCLHIYLYKIGVPPSNFLLQQVFTRLSQIVNSDSSLATLSRFLIAAYGNNKNEVFDKCKSLLSTIVTRLDNCNKPEELKLISVCFNVLHNIISDETLKTYVDKVEAMISQGQLTLEDTDVLIKVIMFLHYPQWRYKYAELLSNCIMLLKSKLGQLSLHEILSVNEVVIRTQEPAAILFELQRCSAKMLRELEENCSPDYLKRLKLANSLMLFSSPRNRPESKNIIQKYFSYPLNGKCLLELLKGIQYMKIMDPLLCKSFWDRVLIEMEHDEEFKSAYMLKICYMYMNYNQNLPYRHSKLEKRLNQWIEGLFETTKLADTPQQLIAVASFVIPYGNDVSIMNYIVNIFRDRWQSFGPGDCVNIARSMLIGKTLTKNVYLKDRYYNTFSDTIDKIVDNELTENSEHIDIHLTNLMIKTYIYRNQIHSTYVNRLLLTYKDDTYLSSRQIKTLTVCFLLSSALVPAIVDKMVEYICKCKKSIMAFNAEKVAFLCYYLGYVPKNCELFSKVLIDLILRDQEKVNGLSYIQSCLSLCFFNKMTGPLIKQIFNVRFMEKLDFELKNCYAKDIYPNRVHNRLMQLNRTVCIDYPQLNIPWFHQKFVEQYRKVELSDPLFHSNVENYLQKIFYDCDIDTNSFTPYGYTIDFTIKYKDDDNKPIKLAILLLKSKAYTIINQQLKGPVQTKIRHVEMLGYKVRVLRFNDWNNLVYGEDKIAYIKNLLNLPDRYPNFYHQINR